MFSPLPDKPDHDALERAILEVWEREETFARLREQNAGGPRFSFVDGPVTANRMVLGVHTAWGRTLKDVFQRYKALRGFHQRYQNGFDCQGLWIEVGVERSLGLNSKREIEEYGLAEFARRCREVVVQSSQALTEGSIRLGQWMDWGNDYFTFSDTNIEYIWRFLQRVHERGWLYLGHRSTEWCPRCGTSLSQHELTQAGVYQERSDPSLFVRFPLLERPKESRVVRPTSPRRSSPTRSTGCARTGSGWRSGGIPTSASSAVPSARSSSASATAAPSTTSAPGARSSTG
jgi:isoleucyl-tRNA synthetase